MMTNEIYLVLFQVVSGMLVWFMVDERSSSSILRKSFLSPRRGSNQQPSDDRLDALTIEPPRSQMVSMELEDRSSNLIYPSYHVSQTSNSMVHGGYQHWYKMSCSMVKCHFCYIK